MSRHTRVVISVILSCAWPLLAQQKPQWMPGQIGLNAGILSSPGFTYVNMDVNYDAGSFNDRNGNAVHVSGTYNVWALENIFYFVPKTKFLDGNLGFMVMFPTPANGSLVADFERFPNLGVSGGGYGVADLWVQPFTLGWHLKRADIQVGDAFMVPTGRHSPGATNHIGTGYFGNHLQTETTSFYVTKNKGSSVNLFTDWEVHGQRQGANNTYKTPGQAFTDEWGIGQILPLKKDFSKLLQLGVIGYDQWQVTAEGGTIPNPLPIDSPTVPASVSPFLLGTCGRWSAQLRSSGFSLFFKYEHEYKSYSDTLGNTIVFGGTWTLALPKPAAPKS